MGNRHAWTLVSLVFLPGCFDDVPGNGELKEVSRNIQGFTKVDSRGSLDVEVVQGDDFDILVSIDSNLHRYIETYESGDTLVIDLERGIDPEVDGPFVRVTLPRLRGVTLSGSGRVDVVATENPQVDLTLSGSGTLSYAGASGEVDARLSGSGSLTMSGGADYVALDLAGSGALDAQDLTAAEGEIELDGSGWVRATVTESVDVDLDGSGQIDLFGGAEVDQLSLDGSGELEQHD